MSGRLLELWAQQEADKKPGAALPDATDDRRSGRRAPAGTVGGSESGATLGNPARKAACGEDCSLRFLLRTGHAGLMLHAPSAPLLRAPWVAPARSSRQFSRLG
jgi:hypothetical protein